MKDKSEKELLQELKDLQGTFKKQSETIMKLQDQINFLKFDKSENLKIIEKLKNKVRLHKKTQQKIKEALESINRTGKYEDLNKVIALISEGEVSNDVIN